MRVIKDSKNTVVSDKPTESDTVEQIKAYLDAQGIKYTASMNKSQLLALVK